MRSSFICAFLITGLCACNPVPPLTNAEKAKYLYELIEDAHNCDSFRTRLAVPGLEGPAIESLYKEATKAGCVKRDV